MALKNSQLTLRRALEVNLTSVFHLRQIFSPLLSKAQDSYIINVSSIYGSMAPDWELYEGTEMKSRGYALSKAGLNQLTRWLSTTLAPKLGKRNSAKTKEINLKLLLKDSPKSTTWTHGEGRGFQGSSYIPSDKTLSMLLVN